MESVIKFMDPTCRGPEGRVSLSGVQKQESWLGVGVDSSSETHFGVFGAQVMNMVATNVVLFLLNKISYELTI